MVRHLYMPDSSDFWYGRFTNFALYRKKLVDELVDVFCASSKNFCDARVTTKNRPDPVWIGAVSSFSARERGAQGVPGRSDRGDDDIE